MIDATDSPAKKSGSLDVAGQWLSNARQEAYFCVAVVLRHFAERNGEAPDQIEALFYNVAEDRGPLGGRADDD